MTFLNSGYQLIRKNAKRIGLDITIKRAPKPEPHFKTLTGKKYEDIKTNAAYAPWNTDKEFNSIWEDVRENILVDKYRCWELWELVEQVAHIPGAILEIGCWRGGAGAIMARRAALLSIPDPVYFCDTFTGVPAAGPNDSAYKGGEHADTSAAFVRALLKRLKLTHGTILKGTFPKETGHLVNDTHIRLCHIDVDIYSSAKDASSFVWKRMPVGGIIVYDDYGFRTADGVQKFVDSERKKKDRIVLYNLNGHGIIIKTKL